MSSAYRPNRKAFEEMAVGPEIRAVLNDIAEKAKAYAEGLSQDFRITGEYASSFRVVQDTVELRGRFVTHRAAARLENTASYAAAVEWGNAHDHKPHRVLGRTLDFLEGQA